MTDSETAQKENSMSSEEAWKIVAGTQKPNQTWDETMTFYEDLHEDYDKLYNAVGYRGPYLGAFWLAKMDPPKDDKILDVAAGTGLAAIELRKHGYTNIDALDASAEMLEIAKHRNLYTNIICSKIGDGQQTPILKNTYDHAIMVGGFAGSHIKMDALEEMIRVVKPGGYIVNAMREEHRKKIDTYVGMHKYCQELREQGKWELVMEVVLPKWYEASDLDGLVQIYCVS
jgi:ubiquinone/menaquinone biosynthesis C-methylase UbiE